ncbi:prealbumin-like fold domain-containing protein, partial [Lacticaseibacillus paracasei]
HPIKVILTNDRVKPLSGKKVDRTYATHVLPGGVFRLTNSVGYSRDVTTDENGIASFGDLLLGRYSLTEIKAPAGDRLDNTVYPIAVSSAETPTAITVKKEIADEPDQVNLTKYDKRVKKDD